MCMVSVILRNNRVATNRSVGALALYSRSAATRPMHRSPLNLPHRAVLPLLTLVVRG